MFHDRINFSKNKKQGFKNICIDYSDKNLGQLNDLITKIFKDLQLNILFQSVNFLLLGTNYGLSENDFNSIKRAENLIKLNIDENEDIIDNALEVQFSVLLIFDKRTLKTSFIFYNIINSRVNNEIFLKYNSKNINLKEFVALNIENKFNGFYIVNEKINSFSLSSFLDSKNYIHCFHKYGNISNIFGIVSKNESIDLVNTYFLIIKIIDLLFGNIDSVNIIDILVSKKYHINQDINKIFKIENFSYDFSNLRINDLNTGLNEKNVPEFRDLSIKIYPDLPVFEVVKNIKNILSSFDNLYLDKIYYKNLEIYPQIIFWEKKYDEYLLIIRQIQRDMEQINSDNFMKLLLLLENIFPVISIYKYDKINRNREN